MLFEYFLSNGELQLEIAVVDFLLLVCHSSCFILVDKLVKKSGPQVLWPLTCRVNTTVTDFQSFLSTSPCHLHVKATS